MSVAARIVELRKARGWTQAKLATIAQLSASAIAMYETNRRVPDPNVIHKLATALETTVEEIYTEELGSVQVAVPTAAAREQSGPAVSLSPSQTLTTSHVTGVNLTTFTLNRDEAKFILFLRMNPQSRVFLESYVLADEQRRLQLERTWRIIHDFQK